MRNNNFYDFYDDDDDFKGYDQPLREETEDKHVLTELITLLRSALNILEVIISHLQK